LVWKTKTSFRIIVSASVHNVLSPFGPTFTGIIKQFGQYVVLTLMIDLFLNMNLTDVFSQRREIVISSVAVSATSNHIILNSHLLFCYENYIKKNSRDGLFPDISFQGICSVR
jgi:hypothetical protein